MVSIQEGKKFLMNCCNVSSFLLDSRGDLEHNSSYWRVGKFNGPPGYLKKFIPPIGWTAIGLKVSGRFDGGNDNWLGTSNGFGEWYIGYHGVKSSQAIHNICLSGFKKGPGQQEKYKHNSNSLNNFLYPECGEGAYFAQDIDQAASYTSPISYNGKNYKVVFMCRINPNTVKISEQGYEKDYMIANGEYNEVRPYRVLIKNN